MTDAGHGWAQAPGAAPKAPPGWYPDFWTPSRRRYWNGATWTFATLDQAAVGDPPPLDARPLPDGHGLPEPVVNRPAPTTPAADGKAAKKPQRPIKWAAAIVVGLLVGVVGVVLSNRSSSHSTSSSADRAPATLPAGPSGTTTTILSAGTDPSANALTTLVVKPDDVPATADVVLFPGGAGLSQPTLDLCNGRFPSESKRTARIQDAVLDDQGAVVFSTEAVLYGDSGGTTQAFAELQSVVAGCPKTAQGAPPEITTFNPPPDAGWAQTPTVNRRAYDFLTDDGSGPPVHTIAVYLQRGRALLGVYFSRPDGPQLAVGGQTTVDAIVGVFAARMAALPTSVVGA